MLKHAISKLKRWGCAFCVNDVTQQRQALRIRKVATMGAQLRTPLAYSLQPCLIKPTGVSAANGLSFPQDMAAA